MELLDGPVTLELKFWQTLTWKRSSGSVVHHKRLKGQHRYFLKGGNQIYSFRGKKLRYFDQFEVLIPKDPHICPEFILSFVYGVHDLNRKKVEIKTYQKGSLVERRARESRCQRRKGLREEECLCTGRHTSATPTGRRRTTTRRPCLNTSRSGSSRVPWKFKQTMTSPSDT
jgi:hypothetical protein